MHSACAQRDVVTLPQRRPRRRPSSLTIGGALVETVDLLNTSSELKVNFTTCVRFDSSAGRALTCKVGFDRTKHIYVKVPLIQQTLCDRDIKLVEVI